MINKKTKILILILALFCLNPEIVGANKLDMGSSDYILFIPVRKTFESMGYEVQMEYPTMSFSGKSYISAEILEILGYTYSFLDGKLDIESKLIHYIKIGDKASDFKLKNINGNEITLNEIKGKKSCSNFLD